MNYYLADNPELLVLPNRLVKPFPWVGHIPFAFHAVKLLQPRILVELGVHIGNSFSAFCQGVTFAKTQTRCYGVDTWRGDEHAGYYDDSIYNGIAHHVATHYSEFAHLLRMTFDEALSSFSDASIDLLHIDGLHTYDAVRHDYDTWLPKVSDRGVVLFHDTAVRTEEFGVWRLWEELKNHYPSYEFSHGFGLGVLAVGKSVPLEFLEFLKGANEISDYQAVFARLGNSLKWLGESEEAARLAVTVSTSLNEVERRTQALEQRIETLGLVPQLLAQLSVDTGAGYTEEQTGRLEIASRESTLEFDIDPLAKTEPVKRLRVFLLNSPVVVRLHAVELIDRHGAVHAATVVSDNRTFDEGDCGVYDTNLPEIVLDPPAGVSPARLIIRLEYVALGIEFQAYLTERFHKAVTKAGLVYSERTGKLELSPELIQSGQEQFMLRSGEAEQNGQRRLYDENLLAAAVFLHEELRLRDEAIKRRSSDIAERERILEQREQNFESELIALQRRELNLRAEFGSSALRAQDDEEIRRLKSMLVGREFALSSELTKSQEVIRRLKESLRDVEARNHRKCDQLQRELSAALAGTAVERPQALDSDARDLASDTDSVNGTDGKNGSDGANGTDVTNSTAGRFVEHLATSSETSVGGRGESPTWWQRIVAGIRTSESRSSAPKQ